MQVNVNIRFVFTTLIFFNVIHSQTFPNLSQFKGKYEENLNRSSPETSLPISNNADNSIDENAYLVGAGDKFSIFSEEVPTINYIGFVNQDLAFVVYNFGVIKVGEVRLIEAKKIISDYFEKKLSQKVNVYLSEVKNVTFSVIGNSVRYPGSYFKPGVLRIFDAIRISNGDTIPSLQNMNFREVIVANKGKINKYDLYKFIFKGDFKNNPYIYTGDEIFLEPTTQSVRITGEIKSMSGFIPILPNENLKGFLSLFSYNETADSNRIQYQRKNSDGKYISTIISIKEASNHTLKNRDMIHIHRKSNHPKSTYATVSGEIESEGDYPIIEGNTTISEMITLAGGLTGRANYKRAVIIRWSKKLSRLGIQTNPENASFIRQEFNASLEKLGHSHDYIVIPINEKEDLLVEPEDQIFIPRTDKYVYLSGEVKQPGAYLHNGNTDLHYFINVAGGYSKKADKSNLYVITQYGNVVQTKDASSIEEGSTIVIPMSKEFKKLESIILPIIQLTITITGLIISILGATK